MAQTMFALGNYRGAAIEAHAALALGAPMDWNTLQADYGDVSAYTTQLRALEQYASAHPSAPEARFLLGYQYLMLGYPDQARDQFAEAVKLVPADKLAVKLLASLGGRREGLQCRGPEVAVNPQIRGLAREAIQGRIADRVRYAGSPQDATTGPSGQPDPGWRPVSRLS